MVSTVPVMIPLTVRRRLQPRPRALAQWNKALETSPKSAAAHYNLFDLYSTKLMYDNAVAQLEQALGKSTRVDASYRRAGYQGVLRAKWTATLLRWVSSTRSPAGKVLALLLVLAPIHGV